MIFRRFVIWCVILWVQAAHISSAWAESRKYTVVALAGQVQIVTAGSTLNATTDMKLSPGDRVRTGMNSFADIAVGEIGVLRIEERTEVLISDIAFRADEERYDVELAVGSILAVFSKLRRGMNVEIKTPTQVACVRGTGFAVAADGEGSGVEVIAGEVTVHPVVDGRAVRGVAERIREGQALRIERNIVREIAEGRRRLVIRDLAGDDVDRLVTRFQGIRESSGFEKLGRGVRDELVRRIMKRKRSDADQVERERIHRKMQHRKEKMKERERRTRGK